MSPNEESSKAIHNMILLMLGQTSVGTVERHSPNKQKSILKGKEGMPLRFNGCYWRFEIHLSYIWRAYRLDFKSKRRYRYPQWTCFLETYPDLWWITIFIRRPIEIFEVDDETNLNNAPILHLFFSEKMLSEFQRWRLTVHSRLPFVSS
jgi:hypothetical protein